MYRITHTLPSRMAEGLAGPSDANAEWYQEQIAPVAEALQALIDNYVDLSSIGPAARNALSILAEMRVRTPHNQEPTPQ